MPSRHVSFLTDVPPAPREGFTRLRDELGVPDGFPDAVLAEAEAAAQTPRLPERDLTDVPFVTIDPQGSTDLDQAVHIEASGDGHHVRYAIADVAAFVAPGGAIDAETRQRGMTLYAPNGRTPLHPEVLSEGAASLLPGQVRPALVWDLTLDGAGVVTSASVERARVRSTEQLTYAGVQEQIDAGSASGTLALLAEVGRRREQLERDRGGVSLPVPEQEVASDGDRWTLEFRSSLPVEGWNAQISLMTGMAAAEMMLDAGVGILRTLPPAPDSAIDRLRRTAQALGISWPQRLEYPEFVRTLTPDDPRHAAMLNACTTLFRGAGYDAFSGESPGDSIHAAIAAPYAHTTAPLRRLVDRFAGEICVASCAGQEVPVWVLEALDDLPTIMAETGRRANAFERGVVDLVEALVLSPSIGREFDGVVIDVEPKRSEGRIQIADPAVEAPVQGAKLVLGRPARATLVGTDLVAGTVDFRVLG